MRLGLLIFGIDDHILDNIPEDVAKRQTVIYNFLGLMLLVLSLIGASAGLIYGIIIFGHWGLAIGCSIFLGLVFFLLLQLLLFLSLQTRYASLKQQLSQMEEVFKKYPSENLGGISDEEALEIVSKNRMNWRGASKGTTNPFHFSQILISTAVVSLSLLLSFLSANAVELFIFRKPVNQELHRIKQSEQLIGLAKLQENPKKARFSEQEMEAYWTLKMVSEQPNNEFKFIDCYSLLLVFDVLQTGLGNTKILIDLLFAVLFLVPYVAVKKSDEISGGIFLKEVVINSMSSALLMHLLSGRTIEKSLQKIKNEFDYHKALGKK